VKKKKITLKQAIEAIRDSMYDVHKIPKGSEYFTIDDHGEIQFETKASLIDYGTFLINGKEE